MKDGVPEDEITDINPAAMACITKDRLTRRQASQIARRMRSTRGKPLQAYKCPVCRSWHVGNRPHGQKRKGRK